MTTKTKALQICLEYIRGISSNERAYADNGESISLADIEALLNPVQPPVELSEDELNELAWEEKKLDDIVQCGQLPKSLPEISNAILEAKRGLEDVLEANGVELGSVTLY